MAIMVGMEYAQFKKHKCILLQIDLDNAYDWITWSFVSNVLKKPGLKHLICNSIFYMEGGSSYTILFNTIVMREFQVKRSIHQGCPLAPLLFATCTHPLIAMLELKATFKEIGGTSLPNGEQLLAKLFENDSLLFLKVELENISKALEIVQLFAMASGSQCNIEKSRLIA